MEGKQVRLPEAEEPVELTQTEGAVPRGYCMRAADRAGRVGGEASLGRAELWPGTW